MATFTITTPMRTQRIYSFDNDRHTKMCIYGIVNKKNGKFYIGQSTQQVSIRWRTHCGKNTSAISNAIRKYGIDQFSFFVIQTCNSIKELNEYEEFYVDYFNCIAPNGYNLRTGGDNYLFSEESKIKMSKSACNRFGVDKSKKKIRQEMTEEEKRLKKIETNKKIAIAKTGVSSKRKGEKFTKEWCENIRLSKIGNNHRNTSVIRNDGKIFESIKLAAKHINATPGGVVRVLSKKRNKIYGYSFEYLNKKGGKLSQHLQSQHQ